jgi:hypothetical protein
MYKQVITGVLVIVTIGVLVGLAIGLPSNRFHALEQTTFTDPTDPEARAADAALGQFPQIIGEIALQNAADGKLAQTTSSNALGSWLAPKASAQEEIGGCTEKLEEKILDEAMTKLRAAFDAEVAALRKQGLSIKDPCFTIKGEVKIDATLYHAYPIGSTDPYGYQAAVTVSGVLKLYYYDENCQYKEVVKRFDKRTSYFKWVKPGKLASITALTTPNYSVCITGMTVKYDEPMGECPRCKITATPTQTQQ